MSTVDFGIGNVMMIHSCEHRSSLDDRGLSIKREEKEEINFSEVSLKNASKCLFFLGE
jgi:hypothetical protein